MAAGDQTNLKFAKDSGSSYTFTKCDQLLYSTSSSSIVDISKLYFAPTSNYSDMKLIWQKPSSESWVTCSSGNSIMAEYTPSASISVSSFSMILTVGTSPYNYISAIYTKTLSGSSYVGVPVSVIEGTTGVSIVAGGTLGSYTKYTHTKTYDSGSRPSLTAGVTYYFVLSQRYSAYYVLSGSNVGGSVLCWSMGSNPTQAVTNTGSNVYLSVVPA